MYFKIINYQILFGIYFNKIVSAKLYMDWIAVKDPEQKKSAYLRDMLI